jgi:NAD(P)-dependent dehydrogenase (short-subunit alcohol dehydrogenase family)
MTSLEGKVITITGAASGIGLATAHVLASRGATVSMCDVREEALESAVADIQKANPSARVLSKTVDVAQREHVKAWIDATVEKFGKLHGAANVAGIFPGYPGKPVQDTDDEIWYKTLDVNLNGAFICMREQLRILEQGGSIVNISSTYGLVGAPDSAASCASKVL